MIARLRRLRAGVLGLNRRNHGYVFAYNAPGRHRVVDDKQATKALLAAHGVAVPALHAAIAAPWEIRRRLRPTLDGLAGFVLKPARGAGGAGIVVVTERRDGAFVKASGEAIAWPPLAAHAADIVAGVYSTRGLPDALLVETLVVAEPTLAALAWRGVPDVRVLVFRGVPVMAMLRLPTRRSDGRANLHLGGVGVGVDVAAGRTAAAVLAGRPIAVHPDLGCPLAGVAMPAWDDVLLLAVRAADVVGLGFTGVDVVVDARRGPLVLELNSRPGLTIQLANGRGLRPVLDAVAGAALPEAPAARVALGRRLAADQPSAKR
jgi:alpha-L-glutamate ligase-like protein